MYCQVGYKAVHVKQWWYGSSLRIRYWMLLMVLRCCPMGGMGQSGIWNGSKRGSWAGCGEVSDVTPRDAGRQTPHTWHLGTNNIPTVCFHNQRQYLVCHQPPASPYFFTFLFIAVQSNIVTFQIPYMLNNTWLMQKSINREYCISQIIPWLWISKVERVTWGQFGGTAIPSAICRLYEPKPIYSWERHPYQYLEVLWCGESVSATSDRWPNQGQPLPTWADQHFGHLTITCHLIWAWISWTPP